MYGFSSGSVSAFTAFWGVSPCMFLGRYRRFGDPATSVLFVDEAWRLRLKIILKLKFVFYQIIRLRSSERSWRNVLITLSYTACVGTHGIIIRQQVSDISFLKYVRWSCDSVQQDSISLVYQTSLRILSGKYPATFNISRTGRVALI